MGSKESVGYRAYQVRMVVLESQDPQVSVLRSVPFHIFW